MVTVLLMAGPADGTLMAVSEPSTQIIRLSIAPDIGLNPALLLMPRTAVYKSTGDIRDDGTRIFAYIGEEQGI